MNLRESLPQGGAFHGVLVPLLLHVTLLCAAAKINGRQGMRLPWGRGQGTALCVQETRLLQLQQPVRHAGTKCRGLGLALDAHWLQK